MAENDEVFDDFFAGSGERIPSFKFEGINTGVRGVITHMVKQQQTAFGDPDTKLTYDDNTPRMQVAMTLQTDLRGWQGCSTIPKDENDQPKPPSEDDGRRRIFIKNDMTRAAAEAFRAANAPGPRVGGLFAVKQSGAKPTGKGNDLPLYEARYAPPAPQEDAFFDAAAPAQSAPVVSTASGQPVVHQQQVPAPAPQAAPPADPWATQAPAAGPAPQDPWAAAAAPAAPAQPTAPQPPASTDPPF